LDFIAELVGIPLLAAFGLLAVVAPLILTIAGLLWLVARYVGRIPSALLALLPLALIGWMWWSDADTCGRIIGLLPPAHGMGPDSHDAACEGPGGGIDYFLIPIGFPAALVLLAVLEVWIFRRDPRRRAREPKI
jgi:hypothetical protein